MATAKQIPTMMPDTTVVRRWRRYSVATAIKMTVVRNGERVAGLGCTEDVSEGGVAVRTRMELTIGSQVHLEFSLPYSEEVFRIPAMVRSYRRGRFSIEFLKIDRTMRQKLASGCREAQMLVQ